MRHVLIMAGGSGKRLWPLSRQDMPKQLLRILGGQSLLRLAYERLEGVVDPSRVWVCTGADYAHVVAAELPELDPPISPDRAAYVFKRLFNYQDEALEALPDMAANPLAYGSRVFTLVTNLALGNSVVDELFHATHRGPQGRPGRVDPALARATAHEQVRELRRARGVMGYS